MVYNAHDTLIEGTGNSIKTSGFVVLIWTIDYFSNLIYLEKSWQNWRREMTATFQRVVRENPEDFFPIFEATQQPRSSCSPPEGQQTPWCICRCRYTFCREMPDNREKECCKKTTGKLLFSTTCKVQCRIRMPL